MKTHYQSYRHNKGKYEKRVPLEVAMIECGDCERRTAHIHLGKMGILKPSYLYQCSHCKSMYVSLKKLK